MAALLWPHDPAALPGGGPPSRRSRSATHVMSWALSWGYRPSRCCARQARKLSSVALASELTSILSLLVHISRPTRTTRNPSSWYSCRKAGVWVGPPDGGQAPTWRGRAWVAEACLLGAGLAELPPHHWWLGCLPPPHPPPPAPQQPGSLSGWVTPGPEWVCVAGGLEAPASGGAPGGAFRVKPAPTLSTWFTTSSTRLRTAAVLPSRWNWRRADPQPAACGRHPRCPPSPSPPEHLCAVCDHIQLHVAGFSGPRSVL